MAFTFYDSISVPSLPTTQEIIASLSGAQKSGILNGFARGIKAVTLSRHIGVAENAVSHLYARMDEIEETARKLMRGEVLITPAEIDPETGEIITPAVYNDPVTNAATLLVEVRDAFADVFTSAQVEAVLTKMVEYSKHDGSGDWAFYSTEVVK